MNDSSVLRLQGQIESWEIEIDKHKSLIEKEEVESQIKIYRQIEDLRTKQNVARKELQNIKQVKEDDWQEVKQDVAKTWGNVKSTLNETKTAFKEGLDETKENSK